jgi:hypothetical protein
MQNLDIINGLQHQKALIYLNQWINQEFFIQKLKFLLLRAEMLTIV